MNEKYYNVDSKKFRALTKAWYTKKKSWKWLSLLRWAFFLLGVAAIAAAVYFAMTLTVSDFMAVFTILCTGLICSFLPFCLAYVTKMQAIRHVGKPFSAMKEMFLYSNRSGIQFGYHDRYDRKWNNSMIVHQIAYENIHHVEVDQKYKMLTVIGRTERIEYIDMVADRIAYRFTNGQFGDTASFSFFICFENEGAFYDELRAHQVEIRVV